MSEEFTKDDRNTAVFRKFMQRTQERLDTLRKQNDNPALTDVQTAELRGRIAECKALLAQDK